MKRELTFKKEKHGANYGWTDDLFSVLWKIALVCLAAFFCVWFFGKRVSNIGDSMNPGIANGDILLINRLVYNAVNPSRGDVIVFKPKGDSKQSSSVKRVVGLPGETVEIKNGIVYIDGKELEETYRTSPLGEAGRGKKKIKLREQEYFVLGDNRLSSTDSRSDDVGNVKKTEIEGKAWLKASPLKQIGFIK